MVQIKLIVTVAVISLAVVVGLRPHGSADTLPTGSDLKVTPVQTQSTLTVEPVRYHGVIEPGDLQPALGVNALQKTYNPQR